MTSFSVLPLLACFISSQVVMTLTGSDLGAALVNLETGVQSWMFHCKSNVLSLQLDHSIIITFKIPYKSF
ncbi:hypothetical protein LOK49_LG03G02791 [Camellia lanceoleosa]|uniref:Uncharacterized protein n=1 Tax=Camellia lanceoleosa TaxID=1840588 RepID=A0ACC0IBT0_9ERIC|nr:hypothetical protein LOK49_LG03G02791 [Camellia lanceoleosa]